MCHLVGMGKSQELLLEGFLAGCTKTNGMKELGLCFANRMRRREQVS